MTAMLDAKRGVFIALLLACSYAQAGTQAASDWGQPDSRDEGVSARCQWGKSIAGIAQDKLLAGVSRKDFLVSLDSMHYARAWMPRMSQAIAENVYRSAAVSSSAVVQEQYVNDCHQYYLAK